MKKTLLLIIGFFLISLMSFGKSASTDTSKALHGGYVSVPKALGAGVSFFKETKSNAAAIERHRVWLNLTNTEGAFKQILVGYITGATNGVDTAFDGLSIDSNKYIDFYSRIDNQNYVIQGRALPFNETDKVPLGYKTAIEGTFEISIAKVDGLFATHNVFVEDKVTNIIHNLKNGSFSFTTGIGVFNDRFVLRYTDSDPAVLEPPVVVTPPVVVELPVAVVDPPVIMPPVVDSPIVVEAPVVVIDPIVIEPVVVVEPLIVPESPIVELPVVIETPVVVADPIVVESPVVDLPIVIEPVVVESPLVEPPLQIESPVVVTNPIVVEPAVVVGSPIVVELPAPIVIEPVVVESPLVEPPVVIESPVVVTNPIVVEPAVVVDSPIVVELPAPIVIEPVVVESPSIELPAAIESPVVVSNPIVVEPAVVATAPIAAEPPVFIQRPIVTVSPVIALDSTSGNQSLDKKEKSVIVSVRDHQIKINSLNVAISSVAVYDLKGRMLYESGHINSNDFVIQELNSSDQFLIVITELANANRITKKILL